MIKLYSRIMPLSNINLESRLILKLTENENTPFPLRRHMLFFSAERNLSKLPVGFKSYFLLGVPNTLLKTYENVFSIPEDLSYLSSDDIVVIDPVKTSVRVLYRKKSKTNFILLTENCNNFCLMCSQPPRDIDDSYLIKEVLSMIPLISKDAVEIGLTGGEPTLLADNFISILQNLKNYLPNTAIHVLTNGRAFLKREFCEKISSIHHQDLMFGIPVYSDIPEIHDYVVQSEGAFNETIKGIINLKSFGQLVEIRVVLHKQTYGRLPNLAEYIKRNLTFVDHVALMGLEITGFTRANLDELWIDPVDYQSELLAAVNILERSGINVSIYNHQLCLLPKEIWRFSKKSISDWKNEYAVQCDDCIEKISCCGFFASSKYKNSEYIVPIKER